MPVEIFLGVVHGPGPETAAAVDFAVVEAVVGKVFFRFRDQFEAVRYGVDDRDPVLCAADERAALARRKRSDAERRRPFVDLSVVAQPEDLQALDVEPVKCRLAGDPHGPLAEHGMDVGNALDGRFGTHRVAGDSSLTQKENREQSCRSEVLPAMGKSHALG